MNLFFTLLFTAELLVNAFSHWFRPFIQNAWSLLDAFIVAMSLMSLIVTNQPTGIVRILRALRVIRLFGRVKSLKKIISALSLALAPVLNVFLILFLLMGICKGPKSFLPRFLTICLQFLFLAGIFFTKRCVTRKCINVKILKLLDIFFP